MYGSNRISANFTSEVADTSLASRKSSGSRGFVDTARPELYSDDKAQKRWVLKVSDPEQLTEIDSVFVTLEPQDGGEKAKGKKILYAFLGGKANHP